MQLAISIIGNNSTYFINKVLDAISNSDCTVLRLKYSRLSQATASHFLVNGRWNQIAKLESLLDNIQKKLDIHIHSLRIDSTLKKTNGIPYSLETISLTQSNIIESISTFLLERQICIEEINATYYQPSCTQTAIFSVKYILLIPEKVILRPLKDDLHNFSDNLNIDIIFDPIKQ